MYRPLLTLIALLALALGAFSAPCANAGERPGATCAGSECCAADGCSMCGVTSDLQLTTVPRAASAAAIFSRSEIVAPSPSKNSLEPYRPPFLQCPIELVWRPLRGPPGAA